MTLLLKSDIILYIVNLLNLERCFMSKTLHTTGLLKSVTVLSLATGVVFGGKYIIDMNKPSLQIKNLIKTQKMIKL